MKSNNVIQRFLAMSFAIMLVLPIGALADNVVNNVEANPGSDTFTAGGSTTVGYKIAANSGDGQSGCNAADGSSATVTINAPSGVTATPNSLTFTACNVFQDVTFTSNTPGDYSITVSVSDSGIGSYSITPATFTLHVLAPPTPSDTTAPTVTINQAVGQADPTNGTTINFEVVFSESVSDFITGDVTLGGTAGATTAIVTGSGTTYNVAVSGMTTDGTVIANIAANVAHDDAGNGNIASTSTDNTITYDVTPPTVNVTGFSYGDIFHLGDTLPTVGCSSEDASGITSSSGPTIISGGLNANGVGSVTYQCTATDNAGNLGSDSKTYYVRYDGVSGILQPINSDGTSLFSRGRSVPVKFQLAGDEYSGFYTGDWRLERISIACDTGAGSESESVSSTTPSTIFRYDSTADQYIYNADFRDKTAGSCWKVKATLDDGYTILISAEFKLAK